MGHSSHIAVLRLEVPSMTSCTTIRVPFGENGVERGVAAPHVRPPVSYPYAQEGAGGTAKAGSRVDEKSGVRYQPQPLRAGAAQQTPKMVESLRGVAQQPPR